MTFENHHKKGKKREEAEKFYFTPKTNSCASLSQLNKLQPLTFVRTSKVDYLISTSFDVNDSVYGFTNVIGF
jgi:hypothetical protein